MKETDTPEEGNNEFSSDLAKELQSSLSTLHDGEPEEDIDLDDDEEEPEEEIEGIIDDDPEEEEVDDSNIIDLDLGGDQDEEEEEPEEEEEIDLTENPAGWAKRQLEGLKGKKPSDIRAAMIGQKAANQALQAQLDEALGNAKTKEQELEQFREQIEMDSSRVSPVSPEDYGPIKDLNSRYLDSIKKTERRITGIDNKKGFEEKREFLLSSLKRINNLSESEREEKMDDFQEMLSSQFGGEKNAEKISDFLEDSLVLSEEFEEAKGKFEEEQESFSVTRHTEAWEKSSKQVGDKLASLFDVADDHKNKNPDDFRVFISSWKEGNAEKFEKFIEEDKKILLRLAAGDKPFNYKDSQWRGMEETAARRSYHKQIQETKALQADLSLDLAEMGLMAARFFPALQRKLKSGKGSPIKTPRPKNSPTPQKEALKQPVNA